MLLDLGRATEAIAPLERAHALCQNGRVSPTLRGETAFSLAKALWEVGDDPVRARSLAAEARRAAKRSRLGSRRTGRAGTTPAFGASGRDARPLAPNPWHDRPEEVT